MILYIFDNKKKLKSKISYADFDKRAIKRIVTDIEGLFLVVTT